MGNFAAMKKWLLILLLTGVSLLGYTQELTQTVRGVVMDKQTEYPLPGAVVGIAVGKIEYTAVTDVNGKYKLEKIPVGRINLSASYLGYKPVALRNLVLTTGKELVIDLKMEEMVFMAEEFVVKAERDKKAVNNEMATVSARSLTIEETNRYAGTLNDPARMAAAFAGVAVAGDQRNDIIIRGNSPLGVLWRLDGINIPNPNHFGSLGTTGGPISILNNNVLDNSDFMTGAFPAEYGNAMSGAFDLQLRKGNNEKREYWGQVGFNGFEFGTEGPISRKSGSSYLASYRYSTLGVFDALGISFNVGGTPQYQDLTFKVDFPGVKHGRFTVFGIGGLSYIELLESNKDTNDWSFGVAGEDAYYGSNMGVAGVSHTYFLNENTRLKNSIAVSGTQNTIRIDSVSVLNNSPVLRYGNDSYEVKYTYTGSINRKFTAKNTVNIGWILDWYNVNYADSVFKQSGFETLTDTKGDALLVQGHAQWQHRFSDLLTLNTGLHYQYFGLNQTQILEPRAGLKYQMNERNFLSIGGGLHSQIQPFSLYFYETQVIPDTYYKTNINLGFSKSVHGVISYDFFASQNFRIKAETYYQHLYDIPVEQNPSVFSAINIGADFGIPNVDSLANNGTGHNYGLELTLEKFFSKNYYFLITGSLFDSKFTASDGVQRNTAFNGNYTLNVLGGIEVPLAKDNKLTMVLDLKSVLAGGKRYIPINTELSKQYNVPIYEWDQAFEPQYKEYLRVDARLGIRMNHKRITQEWKIDVQNIFNRQNVLLATYSEIARDVVTEYQIGIFPIVQYKITF